MSWIESLTNMIKASLDTKLSKQEVSGMLKGFAKKTDLFSRSYDDLKDKPAFSDVAMSGKYSDLKEIPASLSGGYERVNVEKLSVELLDGESEREIDKFGFNFIRDYSTKYEEFYFYWFDYSNYPDILLFKEYENYVSAPTFREDDAYVLLSSEFESISSADLGPEFIVDDKIIIAYRHNSKIGFFIGDRNKSYYDTYKGNSRRLISLEYKELTDPPEGVYGIKDLVVYKDNYYVAFNTVTDKYHVGYVEVFKTKDFVTFTPTMIKQDVYNNSFNYHTKLLNCESCIIAFSDYLGASSYYSVDGSVWNEIDPIVNDNNGEIKGCIYDSSNDVAITVTAEGILTAKLEDILNGKSSPWVKCKSGPENTYSVSFTCGFHVIPQWDHQLMRPINVVVSNWKVWCSYDGYHWKSIDPGSGHTIKFAYSGYKNRIDVYTYSNWENGIMVRTISNEVTRHSEEWEQESFSLLDPVRDEWGIPEPPLFDGNYVLKAIVVDGAPTYTWEEAVPDGDEVSY